MNQQRTFFDDEHDLDLQTKKLARRTDPQTSRDAAAELKINALQADALDAVRRHPGSTARELAAIEGWDVWKRISELADAGMIRETGVRKCTISGRKARTWQVK